MTEKELDNYVAVGLINSALKELDKMFKDETVSKSFVIGFMESYLKEIQKEIQK